MFAKILFAFVLKCAKHSIKINKRYNCCKKSLNCSK